MYVGFCNIYARRRNKLKRSNFLFWAKAFCYVFLRTCINAKSAWKLHEGFVFFLFFELFFNFPHFNAITVDTSQLQPWWVRDVMGSAWEER
jgi:hypothetical protein